MISILYYYDDMEVSIPISIIIIKYGHYTIDKVYLPNRGIVIDFSFPRLTTFGILLR